MRVVELGVTRDEVRAQLAEVLEQVAGVDPDEVVDEARFAAEYGKPAPGCLDVDSLTMVEVAVCMEERCAVKIPDGEEGRFVTVGDLVDYVLAHGE